MTEPELPPTRLNPAQELCITIAGAAVRVVKDDLTGEYEVYLAGMPLVSIDEQSMRTGYPAKMAAAVAAVSYEAYLAGVEIGMKHGEERGRALGPTPKPEEPKEAPVSCPYCSETVSNLHDHLRNGPCFDTWDAAGRPWPVEAAVPPVPMEEGDSGLTRIMENKFGPAAPGEDK